jgi:NAD(P)-dependent dehydrogenase (short-subunit alcohol dehydrogenase family)
MTTTTNSPARSRVTSRFDRNATVFDVVEGVDLHGKTALVTGGGAGFGWATARALAKAGATVYVADVDLPKTRAAVDAWLAGNPSAKLHALQLDLASNAKVRSFAESFAANVPRLNILVNNAGIMAAPQAYTEDGVELQFAVNFLGHYVLTRMLAPTLVKAGGEARVVSVSSIGHRRSDIRWGDINVRQGTYNTWDAYGQSKTACALLAVEVDRQLRSHGVRSNTLNPGGSMTGLHQHLTDEERRRMGWLDENGNMPAKWRAPEQCAATATWLATAPELSDVGALYFEECQEALPWTEENPGIGVKPYAIDPDNAQRLWDVAAGLAGMPIQ